MSIETVKKLKPITFRYNDQIPGLNDGLVHMGFIAQDLRELFGEDHSIVIENKQTRYLMVQHHELIAPLTKAIQELIERVDMLEKKLNRENNK